MQISFYKRVYKGEEIKEKAKKLNLTTNTLILSTIGFLLGRAVIVDNLGPFGIAYMIYMSKYKESRFLVFLSVITGTLLRQVGINSLKYMTMLTAVYLFMILVKKDWNILQRAISGFILTSIISIAFSITKGVYIYDMMMGLFEGSIVFALVFIYSYGMNALMKHQTRKLLSTEEIISIFIIIGFALSGAVNLKLAGISLQNVLTILFVMIVAYKGGGAVGASSGITMGLITTMNSIASPIYIGIYGFSGLLSGIFNKVSRYASIFGFIVAWTTIVIYTRGSVELISSCREVAFSCVLFLLISEKNLECLNKFLRQAVDEKEESRKYVNRVKDVCSSRLMDIEKAYSDIASTFDQYAEKDKILDNTDIAKIMDKINCSTCNECAMKRSCWKVKFNHTYNMIIEILNFMEENGKLTRRNMPTKLEKHCIKIDDMIKSLNYEFEIFVLNYQWNKKLSQNRKLVSKQLKTMSEGIKEVAEDISKDFEFDTEMEEDILVELDRQNVKVDKVSFLRRKGEKIEINIERKPCYAGTLCDEKIVPIVSKVAKTNLNRGVCKSKEDRCIIRLIQSEEFAASTDYASVSKDGSFISGDNYTHMKIQDGKYMVALSDGMGKGKKAAKESLMTINILENMMNANISEKITVDTINNLLMLKSQEESFSTLDMCTIDLKDGKIKTIKLGASPSFIKRSKGGVEVINSSSLPVGILSDIGIKEDNRHIKEGDFLIMVSDGIIDAGKDKNLNENWLYEVIKKLDKSTPKVMAKNILNEALELLDGKMQDDMTVLVTKIWKSNIC